MKKIFIHIPPHLLIYNLSYKMATNGASITGLDQKKILSIFFLFFFFFGGGGGLFLGKTLCMLVTLILHAFLLSANTLY